ncbi:activator 1 36 kDa, putative [Eimeria praecox]|uniref:Activator 1 36 kDa, putative n=1 Tax=Eimeria praecox TaxID=51316 RepID=U6G4D4_9EIME|nr:activator 1 36 kDa, putative [Eimeria praecox]
MRPVQPLCFRRGSSFKESTEGGKTLQGLYSQLLIRATREATVVAAELAAGAVEGSNTSTLLPVLSSQMLPVMKEIYDRTPTYGLRLANSPLVKDLQWRQQRRQQEQQQNYAEQQSTQQRQLLEHRKWMKTEIHRRLQAALLLPQLRTGTSHGYLHALNPWDKPLAKAFILTNPNDACIAEEMQVERYRPKTLNDILSHDDIIQTSKSSQTVESKGFRRYVDKGQLPHLLFHGPPGTGKTSTILAVARQLYGSLQASHVLELNASDDRGIGSVRELVKTFAETTSASFSLSSAAPSGPAKLKLIILDEADQMTSAAQNALRRIMETYARNVRFCLICNFVNKITPAIQSRCTSMRFTPLKPEALRRKAEEAAKLERMTVTEDGYEALLRIARGDMRRLLNCMQAASMAHPGEPVDGELVHRVLGLPQPSEVKSIVQILLEKDLRTCSSEFHNLVTRRGYSVRDWVGALHNQMQSMKLPVPVALTLVIRLADIEERLALGSGDFVQVRRCSTFSSR